MKRILSITVIAFIACVCLLIASVVVFPMHFGEPSYFHIARIDCLTGATVCALVAIVSAMMHG